MHVCTCEVELFVCVCTCVWSIEDNLDSHFLRAVSFHEHRLSHWCGTYLSSLGWPNRPRAYKQTAPLSWVLRTKLGPSCLHNKDFTNWAIFPAPVAVIQWLSTCGSHTLWELNDPVTAVTCQLPRISDIYIVIHNSSKITVIEKQWNNFMVEGVTTKWGTVLEGRSIRKAEKHCSKTLLTWNVWEERKQMLSESSVMGLVVTVTGRAHVEVACVC